MSLPFECRSDASVRNFDVPPPNQCNALPYNRLPTRRSSLGRVLDSRLYTIPEPTSHTLPKEPQRAPSHGFLKVDPYKSDKSRSKVWSMFGSKSKKTKAGGAGECHAHAMDADSDSPVSQELACSAYSATGC